MAFALTVNHRIKNSNGLTILGTVVLSGSYATPGESIDFGALVGFTNKQPKQVWCHGIAGFLYEYDLANKRFKAKIYDYNNAADGPAIETPDGAYPAGMTGDTIHVLVIFAVP